MANILSSELSSQACASMYGIGGNGMIGASVGSRIRVKREEKGWTQDQLCKAAKISKGFLSDVENDKRSISAENLLKIANALGASLEYLMRGVSNAADPEAPVQIPAALAKAAEGLNLKYADTVALLRIQDVVAQREGKRRAPFTVEEWMKLYQALKPFIR